MWEGAPLSKREVAARVNYRFDSHYGQVIDLVVGQNLRSLGQMK
jgi:hypothetical protein